jgi:flagellar biosynthesis chaperone FliJ
LDENKKNTEKAQASTRKLERDINKTTHQLESIEQEKNETVTQKKPII